MNPQSYRIKLESAIEQRDQQLLGELERIAVDSPVTQRLWNDHCLLENTIEQWCDSPRPVVVQPVSKILNQSRRSRSVVTAISGIACLVLVGWIAIDSRQLETASTISAVSVNSNELELPQQKKSPFKRVKHSYDIVDQGKAILPEAIEIPVIASVTYQVTEEVAQTWKRMAVLPEEMQQVWKQFNLPTSADQQEVISPEEEAPAPPESPGVFSLFNLLS